MPISDLDKLSQDWWEYILKIETDRGNIELQWKDANELARWGNIQGGLYIKGQKSTLQTFYELFPKWCQMWWTRRHGQGLFDLPNDAKIVDVGSGVAVQDLLLAKYLPSSTYTLVDREGFEWNGTWYYDKNYPEYHSWSPVHDGIKSSNLDPNRFTMQGPNDDWPDEVDAVTSYLSWCWHYPKDTYWQKVIDHLKVGGKFAVDVRLLPDRDVMGEINEAMKSEPISTIAFHDVPKHVDDYTQNGERLVSGYSAVWIRKG